MDTGTTANGWGRHAMTSRSRTAVASGVRRRGGTTAAWAAAETYGGAAETYGDAGDTSHTTVPHRSPAAAARLGGRSDGDTTAWQERLAIWTETLLRRVQWVPWDKLLHAALWTAVVMAVSQVVMYELWTKGLWASSNGRVLSFCDSLYSMFRYRGMRPKVAPRTPHINQTRRRANSIRERNFYYFFADNKSTREQLAVLWWAFICKFGGGTLVSLILGETPTWLQGPRHIGSFLLSFYLVQGSPGDWVNRWLRNEFVVQVFLYSACALYKMRKVVFVLTHSAIPDANWPFKVLVALISLESGSISRRLEIWRSGMGLSRLWSDMVDPEQLSENMHWAQQQFWPGVTAVIMIGAGQKCWFCPHTTWSDYTGLGWTPLPVKDAEDTAVGILTHADYLWASAAELAFHPLALILLVYRFLRQLEWSRNLRNLDLVGTVLVGACSAMLLLAAVSLFKGHRAF
eukprot:m.42247 g.42247  ORF g.42247 m.42247 type:complete len:459 (-) comp6248_c0_seq1:325-1701(-)